MLDRWLANLRRRKVLRVAGAYVVAGWGVVQAVEAAASLLSLPVWTVGFVAVLLVAGLPVAMIIAWVVQAEPAAATGDTDTASPPAAPGWLDLALLAAVILVVAVTVVQVISWQGDATQTTTAGPTPDAVSADQRSVAVLPFAIFSDDREDGYFADGLTDQLINGLAQLEGLKVPGRTSSFYFKDRDQDLREIGRQLGVAHLLEGSVRRAGERVRVTVQLVSAQDGFHL